MCFIFLKNNVTDYHNGVYRELYLISLFLNFLIIFVNVKKNGKISFQIISKSQKFQKFYYFDELYFILFFYYNLVK